MLSARTRIPVTNRLAIGDVVEVLSAEEILATLDAKGELASLPFMPEMLAFCGQQFRVSKIANKACDLAGKSRRMDDAVHLEGLRCDGSAHGGCQASCLVYWKVAWLRRIDDGVPGPAVPRSEDMGGCTRTQLEEASKRPAVPGGPTAYSCQTTELPRATPALIPWWYVPQYVRDVRCGNAPAGGSLRSFAITVFNKYQSLSNRILPPGLRVRGGRRYPFIQGDLDRTPHSSIDLTPGELVEVRSRDEIVRTLNAGGRNRGLTFDPEMLKFCGTQATVLRRVERLLDEQTGVMLELKNPCILLADVVCPGDYHQYCPRGQYIFWREIWLRRAV